MKVLIGCVGFILMVGCQVDYGEGGGTDSEVQHQRVAEVPAPHNLEAEAPVLAPNCPGGFPPMCVQCNGADCVPACYGDFYCETGPGWCFIYPDCSP